MRHFGIPTWATWVMGCALIAASHTVAAKVALTAEAIPFQANAFDAKFDAGGNLNLIFAQRGKVFFSFRPAGEEDFGPAHMVDPSGPPIQITGPQSGPKLAVGKDGALYAVWQAADNVRFARSANHGQVWTSTPVRDAGQPGGAQKPAVAVGADGIVHVAWSDFRDPGLPDDQEAAHLYLDSSTDGGHSFGVDRNITSAGVRACPCCHLDMDVDGAGRLWIAYRSSEHKIKETQLLRSTAGADRFEHIQLSQHNWFFDGCPVSGPVMSVTPSGQDIVVAWTNEADMYWSASRDGGESFSEPERLGVGYYRATAAAANGETLLIWEKGMNMGLQAVGDEANDELPVFARGTLLPRPKGGFLLLTPHRG